MLCRITYENSLRICIFPLLVDDNIEREAIARISVNGVLINDKRALNK